MLIERPSLDALLPHADDMCLLDGVVAWDVASIHCIARSHWRTDNPLRSELGLSALCGVEYGAQAMAIHGTLLTTGAGGRGASGTLVSVRDLDLSVRWLHDVPDPLHVRASVEADAGRCLAHRFRIEARCGLLVAGRLMVLREGG